jgi:predicted O-methyltransferase YrrM
MEISDMKPIRNLKKKLYEVFEKKSTHLNTINKILKNIMNNNIFKTNFIIDYNNCIPDDTNINVHFLHKYYIFNKINVDVNSMLNINTYKSKKNKNGAGKKYISTPYNLFICRNIDYKNLLIETELDVIYNESLKDNEEIITVDSLKTKKLHKKYEFVFAHLFGEIFIDREKWFDNLKYFIENNLATNGYLLIQVISFTKEIIIILEEYVKSGLFQSFEFINISYPAIVAAAMNPYCILFRNFKSGLASDDQNIYIEYHNMLESEYQKYITILNDLKTVTDLSKYCIDNTIKYCISVGLTINRVYLDKYNYKTWKGIFSDFVDKPNNIMEIGVYEGASSVWFLSNLMNHENSKLHLVDTWEGSVEYGDKDFSKVYQKMKINIKNSPNKDKTMIFRGRSDKFLMKFIKKNIKFNIIFIDASHDSRDVMMDAMLVWRVLQKGGILIFDDYLWNKMPNDYECPKLAIDSFVKMYRNNIKILKSGYQFIIKKTSDYPE